MTTYEKQASDFKAFLSLLETFSLGGGAILDTLYEVGIDIPDDTELDFLIQTGYIKLCKADKVEKGEYEQVFVVGNHDPKNTVILLNPFNAAERHYKRTKFKAPFIVESNDHFGHHPAIFLNGSYRNLWSIPIPPDKSDDEDLLDYHNRVANFLNKIFLESF